MAERFDVWSPAFRNRLGQFTKVRESVLRRAADYAEKRAKEYAPVRTGELRASLKGSTRGVGTGRNMGAARVFVSCPRKYAPIEFGSRRGHKAQRFLERAQIDTINWLKREMLDATSNLILKGAIGHIGPRFSGRRLG